MKPSSKRLNFKEVDLDDVSDVFHLLSLPEVNEYNTMGVLQQQEEAEKHIQSWIRARQKNPIERFTFALFMKEHQTFVGLFGIKMGKFGYSAAEFWYKLLPNYWNKGLITEATITMLQFCFEELKLHRIEAGCAVKNSASIRVLEKAGFIREGLGRKKLPIRGNWVDNYTYSILSEEFNKSM